MIPCSPCAKTLIVLSLFAACGSGMSTSDATTMDVGGPIFLSFGTNVRSVTDGDTVTFVAVLTHPDGLSALVGGHLTDPTGNIQFDAFVAAEQGSYSLSLGWDKIYESTKFQFVGQEPMTFVAEFFDTKGRTATKTVALMLACRGAGWGTCQTHCFDFQNDLSHCGGCASSSCDAVGINSTSCSQGLCQNASVEDPTLVQSCDQYCASRGGTCESGCAVGPSDGDYQCTGGQPFSSALSCSQVPASTSKGCPIYAHTCCCSVKL